MNKISPKKLHHTKWTAVNPLKKEKHFMVVKVIKPENELDPVQFVQIEAVYSGNIYQILWRDLQDQSNWQQGWV